VRALSSVLLLARSLTWRFFTQDVADEGDEKSRRKMGILWEIVQTGLMYGQHRKSDSIGDRVQYLEDQLLRTQNTLRELVKKLEEMHGSDIDGDGRVG
jgi:hypothetical protein